MQGCASFSKSMELLVHHPKWGKDFGSDASFNQFQDWIGHVLIPQMDKWVDSKRPFPTPWQTWSWDGNVYANCKCICVLFGRSVWLSAVVACVFAGGYSTAALVGS